MRPQHYTKSTYNRVKLRVEGVPLGKSPTFSPETNNTSKIIQNQQVIFKNVYVHVQTQTQTITMDAKKAMNF